VDGTQHVYLPVGPGNAADANVVASLMQGGEQVQLMLQRLATVSWTRYPVAFSPGEPCPHVAIVAHAFQDQHACGLDVCRHVAEQVQTAVVKPGQVTEAPAVPRLVNTQKSAYSSLSMSTGYPPRSLSATDTSYTSLLKPQPPAYASPAAPVTAAGGYLSYQQPAGAYQPAVAYPQPAGGYASGVLLGGRAGW